MSPDGVTSAGAMAFGPGGDTLVLAQDPTGPVVVLDVADRARAKVLSSTDADDVSGTAVRPDGRGFAIAKWNAIQPWTTEDPARPRALGGPQAHELGSGWPVFGGGVLAVADLSARIGLWAVSESDDVKFKGVAQLPGAGEITGVVLGPDGRFAVAVARGTNALSLWSVG